MVEFEIVRLLFILPTNHWHSDLYCICTLFYEDNLKASVCHLPTVRESLFILMLQSRILEIKTPFILIEDESRSSLVGCVLAY